MPQAEHLDGSFHPSLLGQVLRWGKPDPRVQVQKAEAEGMTF